MNSFFERLFIANILMILFSSCTFLFYHPDHFLYATPEQFKLNYEETYFKSSDEITLHAWLLKTDRAIPKATIVFFHGNAQNISAHFLQASWLTKHGYQVFIGDYRGYGLSKGFPDQAGLKEDGGAMITHAYEYHLKSKASNFIIYGQSLGGAVAVPALANSKLKNKVDLLILDSTFHSYKKAGLKALSGNYFTLLFAPLSYLLVSNEHAPYKYLLGLKDVKALFIHSKSDRVVSYSLGEEFFHDYLGPKDFWSFDNYAHIRIFNKTSNQERLIGYLDHI